MDEINEQIPAAPEPENNDPQPEPETVAEFTVRGGCSHTFCTICTDNHPVKQGCGYILQTDKGEEFGEAIFHSHELLGSPNDIEKNTQVKREISLEDLKILVDRRKREQEAMRDIKKKVKEFDLNMKVSNVEFNHDESIIYCYFTAPERVDFRELVRDLGHTFRKRIELKQIGARDETRMLGGFGHCGMQLCCNGVFRAAVLPSVSMKMAKVQKLSTNPQNLLGLCGKLRCCLAFEFKGYQDEGSLPPRPDKQQQIDPYAAFSKEHETNNEPPASGSEEED